MFPVIVQRAKRRSNNSVGFKSKWTQPGVEWDGKRVPTLFCTGNVTWRRGIQTITIKNGCDLTDVLATRRSALLVKSLHWNRKIQCEVLVGKCSLYSNYLVQSSFLFGVGTASPHLFFSTTPLNLRLAYPVRPEQERSFSVATTLSTLHDLVHPR